MSLAEELHNSIKIRKIGPSGNKTKGLKMKEKIDLNLYNSAGKRDKETDVIKVLEMKWTNFPSA